MFANLRKSSVAAGFIFAATFATAAFADSTTFFFNNSAAQAFATTDAGVNAAGGHSAVAGCSGNIAFFGYADCAANSTLSNTGGNRFGETNTLVGEAAPQTTGQAFTTGYAQSGYGSNGSASATASCIGAAGFGKTATCGSSGWASRSHGAGARSSFFLY